MKYRLLNGLERDGFNHHLNEVRNEECYGINEARVEAMRRLCLETAQQATTVEALRRVIELMLERDKW